MGQDRVLGLLGLARKARKTVSGEFAVEKAVQSKKACIVFVAEDASENTKKLFSNKCSYYEIPCIFYGTKETLGNAVGSGARASVAVTDQGLSNALRRAVGI
ncbi:MAG: ribosomal L7Ae/L30e/S12e/Gadd45 family protein [Lachnospiraceae bacterium]|nr:ribosomal L7Ae/L30e/S12e/Gadd45 family protein [Lachnospiraceae bacterium]